MPDSASSLNGELAEQLRLARSADGGFGWAVGASPEPEPTALAALALSDRAAIGWLGEHQGDDGGFALATGEVEATATTALVGLALGPGTARDRAIDHVLANRARINSDVEGVEGWGWTPTTYSWVEPTARTLLLLRLHRPDDAGSIREAESVLADREVEGGGWNYGNSDVNGTDLKAYVQTTAAAVMALQGDGSGMLERGRTRLVADAPVERGGLSLAMGLAALRLTGTELADDPVPEVVGLLAGQWQRTSFLGNVGALAWAVLATGTGIDPLRMTS